MVMWMLSSAVVVSGLVPGPVALVPGIPVGRTLSRGDVSTFTVALTAGEFVAGVVVQGEADLVVSVRAPDGIDVARFDQWDRGDERIALVAATTGLYRLEIRALKQTGRSTPFTITIELPRSPASGDGRRVAAATLATEGKARFAVRDEASLRASIQLRRQALAEWRVLGDAHGAELFCLIGIGDALRRLTEFGEAEAAYREALTLAADDPRSRAELLNVLGVIEWSPKGDVVEARRLLEQAARLWDELGFDYGRAATLTNLAILAWEAGALDEAARQNARAMNVFRALGDVHGEAFVLGNMAIVTDTLGRPTEAIAQLLRAVRMFRQVKDRASEGRALVRLARMQLATGFRTAAIASVQRSLRLVRESRERLAEADALETLGRAYSDAGDVPAAVAAYDAALQRYEDLSNRRGQSNVWHGRGVMALTAGDGAAALQALERARDLRRQIGVRSLEADTLGKMVSAARLVGDLDRANAHVGEAVAIIEHVRAANVFERELRRSYGRAVEEFYAQQVDVLARLHRARPSGGYGHLAWEAADRAKGRGLIERLRQAWAGQPSVADADVVRRELEVRHRVTAAAWALWAAGEKRTGSSDTTALERRLDRLLDEHERVEAEIRRTEPAYAAALDVPGVDLREWQARLDEKSVVLEYALSSNNGNRVFVATADAVSVIDLPYARDDIERTAGEFAALVRAAADNDRRLLSASRRLSQMLLDPVAAWLDRRRVLLVVDGVLGGVPWPAMGMPGRPETPFGAEHEILTAWSAASAALIDRQSAGRPSAQQLIAIVADPVYSADERLVGAGPSGLSRGFRRLTFSRDERDGIVAALPAGPRPFLAVDFDATRSLLATGALSAYRYVQLAVHATSETAQGGEHRAPLSALVFSLVDRQGRPTDGFVRAYEIPRIPRLSADLVVLSACSTALGFDGMSLLAQSFLAAGARDVLASQWDVDDRATAFLMTRLFAHLFADPSQSPAAALRLAQADMRRSRAYSHPSHWAGWVLTGATW